MHGYVGVWTKSLCGYVGQSPCVVMLDKVPVWLCRTKYLCGYVGQSTCVVM